MKIQKAEIAGKLAKLKSVIPGKSPTDFLKGVLFKDGSITATNTEISIVAKVDMDIEAPFILPQRGIDVIESLPNGEVDISVSEKSITIKAPGIINRVPMYPVGSYPELPSIKGGEHIGVDADVFGEAIATTLYAVATEDVKAVHTGLLLRGDGKILNLVGCDGYRVAWNTLDYSQKVDMVIPRDSLQKILQIGVQGDMRISYDLRHAVFSAGDYTVFTRLLEGDFLDYKKAFPADATPLSVDRKALLDAATRASIFIEDRLRRPIILRFAGTTLNVKSDSTGGEYSEDIELSNPYDGDMRIGFNSRYLLEALKSFESAEVECSIKNELSPVTISDGGMRALVLPVRLQSQAGDTRP